MSYFLMETFGSEDYQDIGQAPLDTELGDENAALEFEAADKVAQDHSQQLQQGSDVALALESLQEALQCFGSEQLTEPSRRLVYAAAMFAVAGSPYSPRVFVPAGESYSGTFGSEAIGEKIKSVLAGIGSTFMKVVKSIGTAIGKVVFWYRGEQAKLKKLRSMYSKINGESGTFKFNLRSVQKFTSGKDYLNAVKRQLEFGNVAGNMAAYISDKASDLTSHYLLSGSNKNGFIIDMYKDFRKLVDELKTKLHFEHYNVRGFQWRSFQLFGTGGSLVMSIPDEDPLAGQPDEKEARTRIGYWMRSFRMDYVVEEKATESHTFDAEITRSEVGEFISAYEKALADRIANMKEVSKYFDNLESKLRGMASGAITRNFGSVAGALFDVATAIAKEYNVGCRLAEQTGTLARWVASFSYRACKDIDALYFARDAIHAIEKNAGNTGS